MYIYMYIYMLDIYKDIKKNSSALAKSNIISLSYFGFQFFFYLVTKIVSLSSRTQKARIC